MLPTVSGNRNTLIRVLLADEMPAFRTGVAVAINHHRQLELIGDAADGTQALELSRQLRPTVLLLGLALPIIPGHTVLAAVKREQPTVRVIAVSALRDGRTIYDALGASADGYLPKNTEPSEICQAIIATARGRTYVPSELASSLAAEIRARKRNEEQSHLTPRELEVLAHIAQGQSTDQIANELHITNETVKSHRKAIFRKLDVHNNAAAVAQAFHKRILVP